MSPRPLRSLWLPLALAGGVGCKDAPATAPTAGAAAAPEAATSTGRPIVPLKKPLRSGSGEGVATAPSVGDPARPGGEDLRQRRQRFDENGDGTLSDEERVAMMAARATLVIQRLDTDADGRLSPAELQGAPVARRLGDLTKVDTDGDGFVSSAELGQVLATQMRNGAGFGGWRGSSGHGSGSADDAISTAPDDGAE